MTADSPAPAPEAARNSRYGLALFFLYLAGYAGFMALSAFRHDAMRAPALFGVNLAIVYGLGLILGAVVLAVLYVVLCHSPAAAPRQQGGDHAA